MRLCDSGALENKFLLVTLLMYLLQKDATIVILIELTAGDLEAAQRDVLDPHTDLAPLHRTVENENGQVVC